MTPESFEGWLAFVAAQFGPHASQQPAPDGSIYVTGGDPPLVIVRITRAKAVVWEYAAIWEGPQQLVAAPIRVGSVVWRNLPESAALSAVSTLIDAARDSRLAKFVACRLCDRRTPPELLHEDDVCEKCAKEQPGGPD